MADFDPYRKWLGIPPQEQPPNHYRLLGIGLFESDPDVIANSADRQMSHVRTFQSGAFAEISQFILNELTAARVCLLDPQRKAEYDYWLRQTLPADHAMPPPPRMTMMPPGMVPEGGAAAAYGGYPYGARLSPPHPFRPRPPRRRLGPLRRRRRPGHGHGRPGRAAAHCGRSGPRADRSPWRRLVGRHRGPRHSPWTRRRS